MNTDEYPYIEGVGAAGEAIHKKQQVDSHGDRNLDNGVGRAPHYHSINQKQAQHYDGEVGSTRGLLGLGSFKSSCHKFQLAGIAMAVALGRD